MRIKKARKLMRKALEKDASLLDGYVSNIAMLLQDRFGIHDYIQKNRAARDIIKLIFWH